jgi:Xaa-Pro aminopeptidase
VSKNLYSKRRKLFLEKMKNNSFAIFSAKDNIIKGDSIFFDFPDSNFLYLTGLKNSNLSLLLIRRKNLVEEFLFIEKFDEKKIKWEGDFLSIDKISVKTGIHKKNIKYLDEIESIFENKLKKKDLCYLYNDKNTDKNYYNFHNQILKKLRKKNKFPIENSYYIIRDLREIKSKEEILKIKKSISITKEAFKKIKTVLKNSKNEREIEAILSFTYTRLGASYAFHPIVASGKNSCILHYIENSDILRRKDLLLIDSGAEFEGYKADVSRVFPISGKFTRRQKEVYNAVLDIQKFAISKIKIGLKRRDWESMIRKFMSEKLIELKLINREEFDKSSNQIRSKMIMKYYPHSTGHFLGLDTHDIGDYQMPFRESEVYTVEPGIYIDREKIGIRIEDVILIKKNGVEILSRDIPKEIKDLEF